MSLDKIKEEDKEATKKDWYATLNRLMEVREIHTNTKCPLFLKWVDDYIEELRSDYGAW